MERCCDDTRACSVSAHPPADRRLRRQPLSRAAIRLCLAGVNSIGELCEEQIVRGPTAVVSRSGRFGLHLTRGIMLRSVIPIKNPEPSRMALLVVLVGLLLGSAIGSASASNGVEQSVECATPIFEAWTFDYGDDHENAVPRSRDEVAAKFIDLATKWSASEIAMQYAGVTVVDREFGVELQRGAETLAFLHMNDGPDNRLESALVCLPSLPESVEAPISEEPYDE